MELFDLPLDQLRVYNPEVYKPTDFDSFWDTKVSEALEQPLNIDIKEEAQALPNIKVSTIFFDGYKNSRIRARLVESTLAKKDSPIVVIFHGYNWNNLKITHALGYIAIGLNVLFVDVRGQSPETPDLNLYPNGGPAGWMTKGFLDREQYYYLFAYLDGVRAIEVAKTLSGIDKTRIYVEGGSQGGGMALAVTSLAKGVAKVMADIPFLCYFRRSVEIGHGTPYQEFSHYFKLFDQTHKTEDEIFNVLSYFDNVNLAQRITCPVMVTVGLEDQVCPPSTIFAMYNKITAPKKIMVFPDFGHGGFGEHDQEKMEFMIS